MQRTCLMPSVGSLLFLASCGQVQPPGAAQAAAPTPSVPLTAFFAGPTTTMPDEDCGDAGKSNNSVEFTIKDNVLKIFTDQNYEGRDIKVNGKDQPSPPGINKKFWKTYFDFEIPDLEPGKTWTPVSIIVKKADKDGANFLVPKDNNGVPLPKNSSVALMVPSDKDGNPIDKFCGRSKIKEVGGDQVITFGVKDLQGDTVSFNIGLLVSDKKHHGFSIPIYIDPNMKNRG